MNQVLLKRSMPYLSEDHYLDIFTFPVIDYYKRLGFDFEKEPFTISGSEFIDRYNKRAEEAVLHDDALTTLNAFRDYGMTQSILSASRQDYLDDLITHHQIRDYFIKVLGIDNHYADGKIDIGKAWMDELHYGPHEVLFIGDTLHDLEVADAIGADCALVAIGHTSRSRLKKGHPHIFSSLTELKNYLFSN
jgi:phosphoglycolate phosphatase